MPIFIQRVIEKSGPNRTELTKVISHYSGVRKDSLKLRAAYFLINNLDDWYYYSGPLLQNYLGYLHRVRNDERNGELIMESLTKQYGTFSYSQLEKHYDIKEIRAKDMEANIDAAFEAWKSRPWSADYTFEQFCAYVLPFRIGNEIPCTNRRQILNEMNHWLDPVVKSGGDAIKACDSVNDQLKKKKWLLSFRASFLPHFPYAELMENRVGSCRDQADLGIYIMRSLGIPVCKLVIPQWPTRSMGHEFNGVLDKQGHWQTFGAGDDDPRLGKYAEMKKGKIYQYLYTQNPQSLALNINNGESVPPFFADPHIKDITDEFVRSFDITLPIKEVASQTGSYKHMYLCVFDDKDWIPIAWGSVNKDVAYFFKVEGGIIYLPTYYDMGELIPAGPPFLLDSQGKKRDIRPNARHPWASVILKRIYGDIPDNFFNIDGGRFQGANNPDFSDAKDLYCVEGYQASHPFWSAVKLTGESRFRYVRFMRTGYSGMGEMEFYSGKRKLTGAVISNIFMPADSCFSKEKAIDGDIGTSFIAVAPLSWVGLDLGKPIPLDSIRFCPGYGPPGIKHFIHTGDQYSLQIWNLGRWITLDSEIAVNNQVVFSKVPSGGLYLLRNISADADERIFTYENGKQVWW